MPKSIFTTFTGLHKNGSPLDLLATWRKTFDKASEREVALFQKMYTDSWFTYNTPQMSLTAEAIVGKYNIRFMATLIGDESPTPLRWLRCLDQRNPPYRPEIRYVRPRLS